MIFKSVVLLCSLFAIVASAPSVLYSPLVYPANYLIGSPGYSYSAYSTSINHGYPLYGYGYGNGYGCDTFGAFYYPWITTRC